MSRQCSSCGTVFDDVVSFCGNDGSITIQVQSSRDVDPRLGKQLGEYIVVARVADGAMGRVYEGRHPDTRQRVAIKVLHPSAARNEIAIERFKREYESAQSMDHENIVKVLDFGRTPDHSYFMTMEFLEGEELGLLLARGRLPPPERMLRIVCQIANALEHAHGFGVIHRDLKPDNIFVCATENDDQVKILDFGSVKLQMDVGAKLTALGSTLGSPYYMSPEQAMGRYDIDQRSDIFALAAIAYEMATAKVPFEGDSIAEILMKVVNENPPAPSTHNSKCTLDFDDVILRALDKDKARRPDSAVSFAGELLSAFGLSCSVLEVAQSPETDVRDLLSHATPLRHRYGASVPVAASRTPPTKFSASPIGTSSSPPPDETFRLPTHDRHLLLAVLLVLLIIASGVLVLLLRS